MNLADIQTLPYSEEAEKATLGGLIIDIDGGAWDKIADVITTEDFYFGSHRHIFNAARSLIDQQRPIDVITLTEQLDRMKMLEKAGGQAYLAKLALCTPTSANIRAYALIVRDFAVIRQMISAGTAIVSRARSPKGASVSELLDKAETDIFNIAQQNDANREVWSRAYDSARDVTKRLQLMNDPDQQRSITIQTPWGLFNEKSNGLQRDDLIIIAGRPSMGKTTFAMNIATHAAENGKSVGIFSVEMSADQLMTRVVAGLADVSLSKFNKGALNEREWSRTASAWKKMEKWRLMIDESATLTPMDVRSRARRLMKQQNGLDLIVVDYLQLMTSGNRSENRVQEVAQISRSLKALAKELHIPVIALSQLSRKTMDRDDKRPILSDLRESGAIEQDADLICFVHRPEMLETDADRKNAVKGKAEIIIGKHRNGETGIVPLHFAGATNQFKNIEDEVEEVEFTII